MNAGAASIVGVDADAAVDEGGAVSHDRLPHAVPFAFIDILVFDSGAVVGDREDAFAFLEMQGHPDVGGMAVLDGVLDRLLGDAEEVRGNLRGELGGGFRALEFTIDERE